MRQAPEGDDLADRQRERQLDELGDDGDAPRDGLPVETADRVAVERDATAARFEDAGEDAQERRLAGAVRPDEGDPLARLERQAGIGHDRPVAERDRDRVRGEDRAHSSYPEWVWWSRTRKNGAPRMAMTTPTGRSPRSRATRSAETRSTAPKMAEIGTTRRAAGPDEQSDDVRDDQADEPDQAGDRDRRRRGHRCQDEEDARARVDLDPEMRRRGVTEQQSIERPGTQPDEDGTTRR